MAKRHGCIMTFQSRVGCIGGDYRTRVARRRAVAAVMATSFVFVLLATGVRYDDKNLIELMLASGHPRSGASADSVSTSSQSAARELRLFGPRGQLKQAGFAAAEDQSGADIDTDDANGSDGGGNMIDRFGRDQYLAICAAVKDQHEDIREWAAYHKSIGVGKIHLYDTASKPPLKKAITDHILTGFIDYHHWVPDFGNETTRLRPQLDIYKDCLERYRADHQFIAFIDGDEFLVLKGNRFRSVPALLKQMMAFEPIGGLAVNWVLFGSSGHVARPKTGVLQAYTACMPRNNKHSSHIKSIVNTDYVLKPEGPHNFAYKPGYYAVNERFQKVNGATDPSTEIKYIGLHHYVTKSLEEFRYKSERGSGMGNHKSLTFFIAIDKGATENCTDAVDLGPFA